MKFYAASVSPIIDSSMRGLCTRPYHGHPKGCPNYGERDTCPPAAPLLKDVFDLEQVWALWAEFNLSAHRDRMQERHPGWSERQLVCCRYWQGTVRKFCRVKSEKWMVNFRRENRFLSGPIELTTCPEAMGVNVTATMANIGVSLEWPPQTTTRMVYLVGVKK